MQCQGFSGPCERTDATRNRQNTSYVKEGMGKFHFMQGRVAADPNYAILCPECQAESDEHWRCMWAEYRSMVL